MLSEAITRSKEKGDGGGSRICHMCQQPKHTVYRLKPMESTPPILFPPNRRPQQPAKDLFDSLPFIFKGSIPSSTSKCVQLPANERSPASLGESLPTPEGSWTSRYTRYPAGMLAMSPSKLTLKTAKVQSKQASDAAGRSEEAAKGLAWRMKFKNKWIQEELYARKQDFPDDPGYTDDWGEALEFIEACGCQGALQAAFLEGMSFKDTADPAQQTSKEDDLLDEETMFEDSKCPFHGDDHSCPACSTTSLSAKAATLLRLHRQTNAATAAAAA